MALVPHHFSMTFYSHILLHGEPGKSILPHIPFFFSFDRKLLLKLIKMAMRFRTRAPLPCSIMPQKKWYQVECLLFIRSELQAIQEMCCAHSTHFNSRTPLITPLTLNLHRTLLLPHSSHSLTHLLSHPLTYDRHPPSLLLPSLPTHYTCQSNLYLPLPIPSSLSERSKVECMCT